jgi:N-acetylglucosamine-6-phosphate deacetylase
VHPDGCVLVTDGKPALLRLSLLKHDLGITAMRILDPHLKDGIHEWRDGKKLLKDGDKVYLEGTNTLAGRSASLVFSIVIFTDEICNSVVTLDKCVRNLSLFTGCSLGEAIKCATYNPAKCVVSVSRSLGVC